MEPQEKDPNVYSFMMQMVQEKNGDDVSPDFLSTEADRLYLEFGEKLVEYFEPKLTPEQKQQFDELIENNADQETILSFLMNSINDLESEILNVLERYKQDYISEK